MTNNSQQQNENIFILNPNKSSLKARAIDFAERFDWPVLPVFGVTNGACDCGIPNCSSPGKHPMIQNWGNNASKDPRQIAEWWDENPNANIGIPTGEPSGLFVLDVDFGNGGQESFEGLSLTKKELEGAMKIETGNGFHLYFRKPAGRSVPSRVKILPGIDIRCDGGYVLADRSNHVSGRMYQEVAEYDPVAFVPDEVPAGILDRVDKARRASSRVLAAKLYEGERNDALFNQACEMNANNLSVKAITAALRETNLERCEPPLELDEVKRIAESASRYDPVADIDGTWIRPLPLPELPDVLPLNPAILPSAIRDFVVDTAERMQVPVDFIGTSAMIVAGSLIGLQMSIRPKSQDTWKINPNLWGGLVAEPGSRKSAALEAVLEPVWELERTANDAYLKALPFYQAKKEVYEERRKDLRSKAGEALKSGKSPDQDPQLTSLEEPEPPIRKRYLSNDTTVEALTMVLRDNPNGILISSDELAKFIHGIEKTNQKDARAFYNTAWGAQSGFQVDRIGRGAQLIGAICVGIVGTIQPEPLGNLIGRWSRNPEFADGFIQRFQMLVYPDQIPLTEVVDRAPDQEARQRAHDVFKQLADVGSMGMSCPDDEDGKPYVRYDEEAQPAFNSWYLENATRAADRGEETVLRNHLNKFPKLVASLSLIIHLMDDQGPRISLASLQKALGWAEYLESHARRIYTPGQNRHLLGAKDLYRQIFIEDKYGDEFDLRDVYRLGGPNLKPAANARKSVQMLVDHGHLFDISPNNGKGRTRRYMVNPLAREEGAA